MALINDWVDAGEGIIVSKNNGNRKYRVGDVNDYIDYLEVEVSETRVWVGLTYACAVAKVDENEQPNGIDEVYSWTLDEDSRIIGSYQVQREYQKSFTAQIGTTPVPTLDGPTISHGQTSIGDYLDTSVDLPITITRNAPNPAAFMYVQLDVTHVLNYSVEDRPKFYYYSWTRLFTLPSTSSNYAETLARSDDSDYAVYVGNTAGGSRKYRTIYRLRAYEFIQLQSGYYKSPEVIRYVHSDNDVLS